MRALKTSLTPGFYLLKRQLQGKETAFCVCYTASLLRGNRSMKKRKCQVWVTTGLGLVVTFSLAGISVSGQTGPSKPATSKSKDDERSLQECSGLEGYSGGPTVPSMQFITASLG